MSLGKWVITPIVIMFIIAGLLNYNAFNSPPFSILKECFIPLLFFIFLLFYFRELFNETEKLDFKSSVKSWSKVSLIILVSAIVSFCIVATIILGAEISKGSADTGLLLYAEILSSIAIALGVSFLGLLLLFFRKWKKSALNLLILAIILSIFITIPNVYQDYSSDIRLGDEINLSQFFNQYLPLSIKMFLVFLIPCFFVVLFGYVVAFYTRNFIKLNRKNIFILGVLLLLAGISLIYLSIFHKPYWDFIGTISFVLSTILIFLSTIFFGYFSLPNFKK